MVKPRFGFAFVSEKLLKHRNSENCDKFRLRHHHLLVNAKVKRKFQICDGLRSRMLRRSDEIRNDGVHNLSTVACNSTAAAAMRESKAVAHKELPRVHGSCAFTVGRRRKWMLV